MCKTCGCGKPNKTHKKVIKVAGEKHTIKQKTNGEVIVDHEGNKGKYDKINLTKKAGAKTVKEGEKATRDWHKKNPQKKGKK